MKLWKSFSLVGALALTLVGCKNVDIVNGEIPGEYLVQAQKFVGEYVGEFEGQEGTLSVELTANKMVMNFKGVDGSSDILGDRCASQIGALKRITLSNNDTEVSAAQFKFSAGNCLAIVGDRLDLDITVKGDVVSFEARILHDYKTREECHVEVDGQGRPRTRCTTILEPFYLEGDFTR